MSNICIVGAGYVGLVSAASFAKLGHVVTCLEVDADKVASIRRSQLPIREPHLRPLWQHYQRTGTLRVTSDYAKAVPGSDFVFLCVGTPSGQNGTVDLRAVVGAATGVIEHLRPEDRPIVAIKSTVPVGTAELVAAIFARHRRRDRAPQVVSVPEFLREGHAVDDFLQPSRVVIGARDGEAARRVAGLFGALDCPVVFCDSRTAELIKYTSNAFLATKISFINESAELCESYDVDVAKVAEAVGMDPRIGEAYLGAGLGWGGSCLPKDLAALVRMASVQGAANGLLSSVVKVNKRQPALIVAKLRKLLGPLDGATIAVWGLTFKPDCDDIRESPALSLIRLLLKQGCTVRAYDPVAMDQVSSRFPEVSYCADAFEAAEGCDAIVLATAWREFQTLDFRRLRRLVRRPVLLDGRNSLPVEEAAKAGFTLVGVGRSTVAAERRGSVLRVANIGVPTRAADGRTPSAAAPGVSVFEELIKAELP